MDSPILVFISLSTGMYTWKNYFSGSFTSITAVDFNPSYDKFVCVFDKFPLTVAVLKSADGSFLSAFVDRSSGSLLGYSKVFSDGLNFSPGEYIDLAI